MARFPTIILDQRNCLGVPCVNCLLRPIFSAFFSLLEFFHCIDNSSLYVKMSVSILLPVSPSFHLSFISPSISSYVLTFHNILRIIVYFYIYVFMLLDLSLCSSTLSGHQSSSLVYGCRHMKTWEKRTRRHRNGRPQDPQEHTKMIAVCGNEHDG